MPTSFCSLTNLALASWTISSGWQFSFNISRGVVRIEINKYADDYHIGNYQDVSHFSILRWTKQLVHDGRSGSRATWPSKNFPIIWVCVHLLYSNLALFTRYSPWSNPLLWIRDDLDQALPNSTANASQTQDLLILLSVTSEFNWIVRKTSYD